jgi:ankyrin repeat protein
LEVVQIFMEKLINKNPVGGRYGGTPLHFAAEEGHMEVINCILYKVENKNPQDSNGTTPLHNLVK